MGVQQDDAKRAGRFGGFDSMYWSTQLSGATFALAFAFAYTAWKLARPKVRAEFPTLGIICGII